MIDVGQVIDKYELVERVGQGGMAIVYRGLDRSLKREVAVKVLHRHLADHQEARDRFEREAHAVAKLRHENILEIFDYSGKSADESYIVTEFIAGQTLKQFVTDHPPQHPEIGAMIVVQICRALAHAHAQGILHRDVKPENVMIRSDGVVKLMDFGISQMVDTQRLTVTGQLLGSPAYMSPEHVEGKPLDFRTDVFAAGIVLYQLTVGKLPFEGKNPHEILKRIAECRFDDPRRIAPRLGNELGKIILRAMAREPDDRYRDMSEMLTALEKYLDGSGLGPTRDELARYFKAPAPYEMALKARLVDHLLRRAKDQLRAGNQPSALEQLDRILSIDGGNQQVVEILATLGKQRRVRTIALAIVGIAAAGGGAWALRRGLSGGGQAPERPDAAVIAKVTPPDARQVIEVVPDAAPVPPDAEERVGSGTGSQSAGWGTGSHSNGSGTVKPKIDAGVIAPPIDAGVTPASAVVHLRISPAEAEVRIGDGPWATLSGGRTDVTVPAAGVTVAVRKDDCCEATERKLGLADAGNVSISLGLLPAQLTPECPGHEVDVRIDGKPARVGKVRLIAFGETTQTTKTIEVEFVDTETKQIDTQQVTVKYADKKPVPCRFD